MFRRHRMLMMAAMSGVPMVTLPQNLLTTQPTLIDDFETEANWLAGAGATKVDDTTHYKTGSRAQGYISLENTAGWISRDFGSVQDLSGVRRISLWVYVGNPDPISAELTLPYIRLSSVSNFAKQKASPILYTNHINGWQHYQIPIGDFVDTGSEDWTQIRYMRYQTSAKLAKTATITCDTLEWGHAALPGFMLYVDDGKLENYSVIYQKLKQYGIRATAAIITNVVDSANYCTWAQLQELDAAGWCIINHTDSHTNLTTLNEATQEARIAGGVAALTANGLGRNANYLAYPYGAWNADTRTAISNTGVIAARSIVTSTNRPCTLPPFDINFLECYNVTDVTTLDAVKAVVDDCIAKQKICSLLTHMPGQAGEISVSDFNLLIDYVYAKWKAGLITPITIDDYYKLTLGPVKVPAVR